MSSATFLCLVVGVLGLVCGLNGATAGEDIFSLKARSLENTSSYWLCHVGHPVEGAEAGRINSTKCAGDGRKLVWVGYICAIVAIIFFGSNFVPVKKYDTGDGVFFQWLLCVGLWLVGLVTNFALDSPPFFISSIVGGVLWCTGNLAVVPIIKMIGMTMGLTVWGVSNMLTGWVIGTFVLKQDMSCPSVSYAGVSVVVISVIVLAFVKSEGRRSTESLQYAETQALLGEKTNSLEGSLSERMIRNRENSSSPNSINSNRITFGSIHSSNGGSTIAAVESPDDSWVDKLGVWQKRVIGFGLALVIGVMFAAIMLPVQFLKLCDDPYHTCNDIDYLFGVYCGILLASTFYMFVYSAIKWNLPKLYPKTVIPGIVSGIMWGIAMLCWFEANGNLSLAVSFPLVTAGPGFVSSAWGIIVYREIKGWRNITLYLVAFLISLGGLIANGLAKDTIKCKFHHVNTTTTG